LFRDATSAERYKKILGFARGKINPVVVAARTIPGGLTRRMRILQAEQLIQQAFPPREFILGRKSQLQRAGQEEQGNA